ncbi:MAG TPA: hypothetical protein VI546_02140 [candidate division Zixibacteria bacterium]|nr:hypothetical protein [candidate division Zixibacteria bacterium]
MKSPFFRPIPKSISAIIAILLLFFASAFALQPASICVLEGIDDRGDLNLNGVGYEIGDHVLFELYFLYGPSVLSSNLSQRQAQIAASDVNGDGLVLHVSDLVRLFMVITGDANPLPKAIATATPDSAHFQILQTVDSLLISSNSPVNIRGVFLRFTFTGTMGEPVRQDSASGLALGYQSTLNELRLLVRPIGGDSGRIPAGNWPILSIPFTGTLEQAEVQASTFDGFVLPASVSGVPSAPAGQKPAASAPVAMSSCADLIVESFSFSGPSPAPGDSIGLQLSAVIRNTGSVAVGDSFYINFLISQDSSFNSPFR